MPEITVIAHNIRSTHNVGAIFRTCEGFGVKKIILSGYTPYPRLADDQRLPHEVTKIASQIHKTALGAEDMVDFEHYENIEDWLESNQQGEKLPIIALEQAPNSVELSDFKPPKQFALLLGEEVNGIDPKYLDSCDVIVEIPMRGQKKSFNVSVACGVALYALAQ